MKVSVCDVLIRAVDFFKANGINKEYKNSDIDVSGNILISANWYMNTHSAVIS